MAWAIGISHIGMRTEYSTCAQLGKGKGVRCGRGFEAVETALPESSRREQSSAARDEATSRAEPRVTQGMALQATPTRANTQHLKSQAHPVLAGNVNANTLLCKTCSNGLRACVRRVGVFVPG